MKSIPLVDVFAGPGGLSEGFNKASRDGLVEFKTALSIEMDSVACRTLRLRSVWRELERSGHAEPYYNYITGALSIEQFKANPEVASAFLLAEEEVRQLELGSETRAESRELISSALSAQSEGHWVLIGGPPCQAYSLAGRSRRANDKAFYEDNKHFLYKEYLAILQDFAPSVFVMENVKGLLSSTHSDNPMFDMILGDLSNPRPGLRYEILSLAVPNDRVLQPADFILRAENYGVPQRRHRVILVGVRSDVADQGFRLPILQRTGEVSVEAAIFDLPALRSGISPSSQDSDDAWEAVRDRANLGGRRLRRSKLSRGAKFLPRAAPSDSDSSEFGRWVAAPPVGGVIQHETRGHMVSDLERYFYIANHAKATGVSPRMRDFPSDLMPNHKNALSEKHPFEDRFRVQVATAPSTTVVSHIAKDGHYYVHPDPHQMRSLTVREAARLQTFPDDYFFEGNRTQQYHQVGNAVPPLLAWKIGQAIAQAFSELDR